MIYRRLSHLLLMIMDYLEEQNTSLYASFFSHSPFVCHFLFLPSSLSPLICPSLWPHTCKRNALWIKALFSLFVFVSLFSLCIHLSLYCSCFCSYPSFPALDPVLFNTPLHSTSSASAKTSSSPPTHTTSMSVAVRLQAEKGKCRKVSCTKVAVPIEIVSLVLATKLQGLSCAVVVF